MRGYAGRPLPVRRPHPPIMIGGGKKRVLSLAGREADIASISNVPFVAVNEAGLSPEAEAARRVGFVRAAAGDRFADLDIESSPYFTEVTDDPNGSARTRGVQRRDAGGAPRRSSQRVDRFVRSDHRTPGVAPREARHQLRDRAAGAGRQLRTDRGAPERPLTGHLDEDRDHRRRRHGLGLCGAAGQRRARRVGGRRLDGAHRGDPHERAATRRRERGSHGAHPRHHRSCRRPGRGPRDHRHQGRWCRESGAGGALDGQARSADPHDPERPGQRRKGGRDRGLEAHDDRRGRWLRRLDERARSRASQRHGVRPYRRDGRRHHAGGSRRSPRAGARAASKLRRSTTSTR